MIDLIGLRGGRVALLPLERARHLDNAYRWMNDPEITARVLHGLGATLKQEEAFFDRMESDRETDLVWGIHDEHGRHIGMIGLHEIAWVHRHATGGILIGERGAWGRGYATEAIAVRSRFAFDQLNLHRLSGHTFNPAMKRVYQKAGYRHEGVLHEYFWRDGQWNDIDLYGLLRPYSSTAPPLPRSTS